MFVWNLLSSIVGTNKRMINVRFKCGCEWVRLPHDAFPLMREILNLYFGSQTLSPLKLAPQMVSFNCWRFDSAVRYCADTQQRIAGDMSSHRLEGPRWALRFNIMSQRKKGCESLTYPFPGFNFYICLSTTHTCQDNVSRLVLDSVEAWLSGLKRQFAKLVKSLKGLSQVRILLA